MAEVGKHQMIKHIPDILIQFHQLPRSPPYKQTVRCVSMTVDIKGFTALCQRYTNEVGYKGADHLTKTLNKYLKMIVEGILSCQGDILKFAGDAILACWYDCDNHESVEQIVRKVIYCSLLIEQTCTNWDTGIGVYLSVKNVISYGDVDILYVGNDQHGIRHFVTYGDVIDDMRKGQQIASRMSIGIILVSQLAWKMLSSFSIEVKEVEFGFKAIYKQESINYKNPQYPIHLPVRKSLEIGSIPKDIEAFISPVVISKVKNGEGIDYLSEIVRVSIVFINLVLKTEPSSSTDCMNDGIKSLQTAFDVIQGHIYPLKGHINKIFMFDKGCTFLIIFGMPGFKCQNTENHAVIAATRIKETIDQLDISDEISIGITTGKVFCGVVGHESYRHEYTVIGRKTNMAARFMTNYCGKIICDKDTFCNCKLKRSNFANLHPIHLKGIGLVSPYQYSRDIRNDIIKAWIQDIRPFKYPMIGRKKELKQITERLELMKSHNEMQKIVIEGSDGIGKSRLLSVVSDVALQMDYSVISAAGVSDHTDSPFYLARILLLKLLNIPSSSEKQSFSINQLQMVLSRYHWYKQHLWLLKDLFNLQLSESDDHIVQDIELPPNIDIKTAKKDLLSLILQDVIEHSQNSLIFIIDDIQVIDEESMQILNHLLRHTLIKLVITRSLLANEMTQDKLESNNNHNQETLYIRLDGLTKEELVHFACQVLEVTKITSSLQRLIMKYYRGGVPSWCEDLLHCLLYDGYIYIVQAKECENLDIRRHSNSSSGSSGRRNSSLITSTMWLRRESTRSESDQGRFTFSTSISSKSDSLLDSSHDVTSKKQSFDLTLTGQRRVAFVAANPDYLLASTLEANNICAIPSGVSLLSIRIPDPTASAIHVKVDHLSPMDQLIVKHAAVIGITFTTDILYQILLANQSISLDILQQCIKRLKNNRLIECASLNYGRSLDPDRHWRQVVAQNSCQCRDANTSGCYQLRFCTDGIRQTIYELLTTEVRKDLHTRIAIYLESRACKCQACGGGQFETPDRPVLHLSNRYSIFNQHSLTMYTFTAQDYDQKADKPLNDTYQDPLLYHGNWGKRLSNALFKRRYTLPSELSSSSQHGADSRRRFTVQESFKFRHQQDAEANSSNVSSKADITDHIQQYNDDNTQTMAPHTDSDPCNPLSSQYNTTIQADLSRSWMSKDDDDDDGVKTSLKSRSKNHRRHSSHRYRRISLSFLRQKHERSLSYKAEIGAQSYRASAIKSILNQFSHQPLGNTSQQEINDINPIELAILQASNAVLKFGDCITSEEIKRYSWNRRSKIKAKLQNNAIRRSWRKSIKLMYQEDRSKPTSLSPSRLPLDDFNLKDQSRNQAKDVPYEQSLSDQLNLSHNTSLSNPSTKCKCDVILKSVYEELIYHWRMAGNTTKVFRYLIERGAGLIDSSPIRALNYLQEAKKLLIQNLSFNQYRQHRHDITIGLQLSLSQGDNNDLFKDDQLNVSKDELFHLELLIGQAYLASDNINRAKEHFYQLLKELKCPQPQHLTHCRWQIILQKIIQDRYHKQPGRYEVNSSLSKGNLQVAQAKCLAHLYYVHRLNNDNIRAYMTALLQTNKIEDAGQCFDQRIIAYTELIETCFDRKFYAFADRLQTKAINSINEYKDEKKTKVLQAIIHLQSVLVVTNLSRGLLQQAIEHGHQVVTKADELANIINEQEYIESTSDSPTTTSKQIPATPSNATASKLLILPMIIQALLLSGSESLCYQQILTLKSLAEEKMDVFALTWYHCCLLDLSLEMNQHMDVYSAFTQFIGQVFCEKVHDDDTILFYYVTANHALWNARHKVWKMANQYLELATNIEPKNFTVLMAARAYSKIVEANLLCWNHQYDNNNLIYYHRYKKSVGNLNIIVRKYPVMKARIYHLRAYKALLRGNERKAKKWLESGLNSSLIPQDHRWIKCSQYQWFGWDVDSCGSQLFHLPRPNQDVEI